MPNALSTGTEETLPMSKKSISVNLSQQEKALGLGYLLFQLILLPSLLTAINGIMEHKLSATELNFSFFLLNFLAVMTIFHRFLGASFRQLTQHPIAGLEAVILGTVAYYACTYLTLWLIHKLDPGFSNANDASITAMAKGSWYLMAVGTVILVPPVEECFYRGLVFRGVYSYSKAGAYLLSMAVFSVIHVAGYWGRLSPLGLALSFLQYLPAGLCLAWSYEKGETIFVPILIHALINAQTIQALR